MDVHRRLVVRNAPKSGRSVRQSNIRYSPGMKYGILLLFVVSILGCPESKYSSCEKAANRYCKANVRKEKTVERPRTEAECMDFDWVKRGVYTLEDCLAGGWMEKKIKVPKNNEEYAEDLESCIASSIMRCVQKSR